MFDKESEQSWLNQHRGWIVDSVSQGPYTGSLIGQIDHMQVCLDNGNYAAYNRAKEAFFLMLEGAGL